MEQKNVDFVISKIEEKKTESKKFVEKYQKREMQDLEEYYNGAVWAFEFSLELFKGKTKE